MEPRTDAFRVLSVHEDGTEQEAVPQLMRNTLFGALWGDDKATLLRVDLPKGEDSFERDESRMKLIHTLQRLPSHLRVLGSGNGLKKGKLWSASKGVVEWCRQRYFETSEEALSYGSLLFSENSALYQCEGATTFEDERVDGQGLVDVEWLEEHQLPLRQIQVRAAWGGCLAKGTLRPVWGLKGKTGKAFAFHETMVKGREKEIGGPFLLGVRDIAERRSFRSGWTVTQWLSEDVQKRLWDRYAPEVLRAVEEAFHSPEGALRLLAALPGKECQKEARDLMHLLLHSGLEPSHPWIRNHLRKHVQRGYLDLALGLGLPLEGGMACWIGGLQDHKVAVPWMPVGAELVIGRYPIRDAWSFRVVKNTVAPVPEGSIGLSENLARQLDGDMDGDYVFVVQDPDVVEAIRKLHEEAPARLERPSKSRNRTPIGGLERVAVEHMGQTGIGTPTWLVGAALASARADLVPLLSHEIQNGVESLKWDTHVDWTVLEDIQAQTRLPDFLELIGKKSTFLDEAPRLKAHEAFSTFWNKCCSHWERVVLDESFRLQDFQDRIPVPTGAHVAEASIVRDFYSSAIRKSHGDEEAIRSAVNVVRAWGAGKVEGRPDWAKTCWHLAHRSSHPKATGSFALHSFPNELAELLGVKPEEIPVALPPALPGLRVEVNRNALYVNEKEIPFEPLVYERRSQRTLNSVTVPIVGGWRTLRDEQGLSDEEALSEMRKLAASFSGEPLPVQLRPETVEWNEEQVLQVYSGSMLLGCIPPEHTERFRVHVMRALRALVSMRGKTLYAVLVG